MKTEPPPAVARGWSKQGAAEATAEMGVRIAPPRFLLKALRVREAPVATVASLLRDRHYLHTVPAGIRECFGVYLGDDLHGVVVFTSGGRQSHIALVAGGPTRTLTLARLWLSETLPPNSESRVLGVVLRHLRRRTDYKLVITHADPAAGHTGTIYRASGWLFLGQTEPGRFLLLADGKLHHTRTAVTRFGSNRARHLTATGVTAIAVPAPAKLRYAYVLDHSWRWRLRVPALPYPGSLCRGPPGMGPG